MLPDDDKEFFGNCQTMTTSKRNSLVEGQKGTRRMHSSGFNNQLLIQKVEQSIDFLKKIMPESDHNSLYKQLAEAISTARGANKKKRVEPTGIHFIEAGEVLVVGQNYVPNVRLCKCDAFGLCEVLRKTVSLTLLL